MKRRTISARDLFFGTLLALLGLSGVTWATVSYKSAIGFTGTSANYASTGAAESRVIRWDTATDQPFAHNSAGLEFPMTAATSSIAPGGYTNANVTVDQFGRITAVSNGLAPAGGGYTTIQQNAATLVQRSVANFTPRFAAVDNAGAARTDVDLASSGVSAGSYTTANITVDAFGRVTAAATGTTAAPKLQAVYNAGANIGDSTIVMDATRRGFQIQDYGDAFLAFGVTSGSAYYLQVLGTTASANFYGLRVWQHINSWNGNTLFVGDDAANTTGVTLGHATGGTGAVDVTVARNLTVNGVTNLTGGFQTGHLILSPTGLTADRTFTFPDATDTVVTLGASQALTAKTLTSPTISGPTLSGTATGTYTLGGTPTISAPVISGGLTASGSAANTFAGSTGDFAASTGALSWAGASGKTGSLVSTAAALTLTAGATSTWDSADGAVKAATLDRTTAGALVLGGTATQINAVVSSVNQFSFFTNSFLPGSDNGKNIGSATARLQNLFAVNVASGTTAATDTAGSTLTLTAQTAGPASAATGKGGGNITTTAGAGGAGSASFAGGTGGNITISAGAAGADGGGGAGAPGSISLQIGGVTKWLVTNAGTFAPNTDLSTDFGTNTLRPTNVYAGTLRSGSTAGTDIAGTSLNVIAQSAGVVSTANGKTGGNLTVKSGAGNAGSGSFTGGTSGNLLLLTDAGGAGTATALSGGSGSVTIGTGAVGATGGAGTGTAGQIFFQIAGANVWQVNTSGTLFPTTDNSGSYFLGAASNRISKIFGAALSTGNTTAAAADTGGLALTINSQQGGAASATGGGAGGAITVATNNGGAGTSSLNGGASGAVSLLTGTGGAGGTSSVSGGSGALTIGTGAVGANGGGGAGTAGAINFQIGGATVWTISSTGALTSVTGALLSANLDRATAGAVAIGGTTATTVQLGGTATTALNFQISGATVWSINSSGDFSPSAFRNVGLSTAGLAGVFSRHFSGAGTAPAIAVGSAAQLGTGPAAVLTAGSDTAGTVTFTSGTAPSAFVAATEVKIATLTFNAAYTTTAPRGIVVSPADAKAGAIATGTGVECYAKQSTTAVSTFDIFCVSSGTPSFVASTPYVYAYVVIQ